MEITIKDLIPIRIYKKDETGFLTFLERLELPCLPRVGEFFRFYYNLDKTWIGCKIEEITYSFGRNGKFEAVEFSVVISK